ncbi:MAG: hypothetical protein LBQ79_03460 [Deltaproteobacteria bacterium]|jgi:hypothetical protein|nr:hypothetical protein [Deltaproteobacteria bacterium]
MTAVPGRPGIVRACAAAVLAAVALAMGGCVLTMPQSFLKQRNVDQGVIPVLNGRWQDQEGAQLTVTPVKGSNNTFTVVSGKKEGSLQVTVERLDSEHFILQVAPSDGKGVFLTIAEISDRRVTIYTYPDTLADLKKAGAANGVTISENGLITKYTSAQGIIAFFRGMSSLPGHKDFTLTKK